MAGTPKSIAGPAYLAAAVANIYTPPAATIYTMMRHIHITNVTAASANFTLYVGATGGSAGGTELFKNQPIDANRSFDYFCNRKMLSTDFLTGLASAANTLVITVDGEQVVV
jgi:hypothetical protein